MLQRLHTNSLLPLKVEWARLTITGRRRLAGFFSEGADRESDIFYAVFLDKNHDFYPVEKKHT